MPKSTAEGITGISVAGFKSIIQPRSIEIRPLTILAGANSSGKSSIIQPLLLLKQTIEASFDPGPLLLEGPNVKFASTDQFFSRVGNKKCRSAMEVETSIGSDTWVKVTFKRHPSTRAIQLHEMRFSDGTTQGTLRPEMTSAELLAEPFLNRVFKRSAISAFDVHRSRCFFEVNGKFKDARVELVLPSTNAGQRISKLIHVPGRRGNPERTYPITGVGATFPGTFENYVASVIANWQAHDRDRLETLSQDLAGLGLTWKITAVPIAETRSELRVGRLPHGKSDADNDLVSIADVGFGVSQALPVLVALLAAEPGQAVYLEEPEIHLHPRVQRQMANVLADAAKRGVRVIAETHSSLLLRSVQTLVARGELAPELVKLQWFSRNDKDGATEISSRDLDQNGAFGDWPADFDEVELHAANEYLDAVEARSAQ